MSRVQLAVYDLSRGMAMAMSQSILGQRIDGIWHTGIVVFGREYYFGGGIQVSPIGVFANSNQLHPVQTLDMGVTSKTQQDLEVYLRSIRHLFTQSTYDLINNNCNNFSDNICKFLTGHGIPEHIVNLPQIVFSTPGGAMLRPMLENMEQSIRRHGSGMDPFGNSGRSDSVPPSFESNLSQSIQSVAAQTHHVLQGKPELCTKANLEERPLISGDASTVGAIGKKLIVLPSEKDNALGITDEERNELSSIINKLSTSSKNNEQSALFSDEQYRVMDKVFRNFPSAHMSCLFVLRLMVLYDRTTDYSQIGIVREVLRRLEKYARCNGDGLLAGDSFGTVPAHVLAICTLSNMLSHEVGASFLLGTGKYAQSGESYADEMVDVILNGLAHQRSEVRQMSSTLAYNLVLYNTTQGKISGLWQGFECREEIHPHALQLMCGCLEGLLSESDATVRKRKLGVICRILRSYADLALNLVVELGFNFQFDILVANKDVNPQLSKDEQSIANEISCLLKAVVDNP